MQLRSMRISALGVTCGLLLAATSAARASSVTLQAPSDINQFVNPGVNGGLNVTLQGNVANNAYVGQINWTVASSNTPNFQAGQSLGTFCIQGLQDVYTGGAYTYDIVNLNTAGLPEGGPDVGILNGTSAQQIQGLANNYFANIGGSVGTHNVNQVAAAFQLAIWEIEYDGGNGGETFTPGGNVNYFAGGNFSATANNSDGSGAMDLANSWLNNFSPANGVTSLALVSTSAQDQLVFQPGGGEGPPPSVPLPAAFPAGIALMGGLFGARKLRRAAD